MRTAPALPPASAPIQARRRLFNRAPQYYDQPGVGTVRPREGPGRRQLSTPAPSVPRRVTGEFTHVIARLR